jgi:hypothetical protein
MRFLLLLFLFLPGLAVGGCESPIVQVGPTSMPAGLVRVESGAVTLEIAPGALTVNATTAPLPEGSFDRLWLWVGIAAVVSVLGYWANHWAREWWTRGRRRGSQ